MPPRMTCAIEWKQPEWREVVELAVRQGTGKGLPKPPSGLPMPGHYVLRRDSRLFVAWACPAQRRLFSLGSASLDYANEQQGRRSDIIKLENGVLVQVVREMHRGVLLPRPVWIRQGE